MEAYAAVLNYAIPGFVLLILIEFVAGKIMGVNTIRSMDTISSLSSGITNVLKDVLKLTIVIFSYGWLVKHVALFEMEATWVAFVLAFIGKDFAGYWTHRFEHVVNVFWNRHIIHHSSEEFNLACALRQSISGILSIFTVFYLPTALLGVPVEVMAIVAPLHLFAQFWYHTTLIKKMGFLEYIIVTPSHHRVHHAINDIYLDRNFSQIFIVWDKIFGTFQPELEEEPPVYGVKKPVRTWNPFLINWQHMAGIFRDAWYANNWWDKVRIWFMPTGWRPSDVAERFPIEVITDPHTQEKYDTKASIPLQVWSWAQLIITMVFMIYLFNNIVVFPFQDVLLYAAFLGFTIFCYTTLMDRSIHAGWLELLRFIAGVGLVFHMDGWYGIGEVIPYGTFIVVGYFAVSLLVTLAFIITDIRFDGQEIVVRNSLQEI